ncbi:hypothetical protein SSX86_007524 [Deinandra increscens subsp. villosa]|uniref:Uncharacterized protein n=1 Tax=Deinandra increscens subsp. villosa TaxID=3103831 RepID=A0AAP0H805_9ASTR
MRSKHARSGGKRWKVKYDDHGRFSGKYATQFLSYLGDLAREKVNFSIHSWKDATKEVRDKLWEELLRFYKVEEDKRKTIMTRIGTLLRSFRSRVNRKDIHPNIGKQKKLARIPRRFRTIILDQQVWDNYVAYAISEDFMSASSKRKAARALSTYNHRLGRGGYPSLEKKLVAKKELSRYTTGVKCASEVEKHKETEKKDKELMTMREIYRKQEEQMTAIMAALTSSGIKIPLFQSTDSIQDQGVMMANENNSPTHSRESQKNGTANLANKHEAVGELKKKKKHTAKVAAKGTIVHNVEDQLLTKQGDQLQVKQTQPNNLREGA